MPVPSTWPPRAPSGRRSIHFYKTGALTANFADNCFIFADSTNNANPYTPLPQVVSGVIGAPTVVPPTPWGTGQNDAGDPPPMIWSSGFRLVVVGGDMEFSFDVANPPAIVHGKVLQTDRVGYYRDRYEAGIAVRGTGTYYIEAW
jgi:hypothetical protein